MARDRLKEIRAQREAQEQAASSSSPSQGAFGTSQTATYQESYEMITPVKEPRTIGEITTMTDFFAEVRFVRDRLQNFDENIKQISELHARSLTSLPDDSSQMNTAQLDALVQSTRALMDEIKARIENLRQPGGEGTDKKIRAEQPAVLASIFKELIQRYQQVERLYRDQCRDRVRRQLKIVNPDATPDQIEDAVKRQDDQQIFANALATSTRYGESRRAYQEVQERHDDIRKIENDLTQLTQLFNDMSILVAQQDEVIKNIEASAITAEQRTSTALRDTKKAVYHAMRARKMRWICFFIFLAIAIALGLGLGIHFGTQSHTNNNSSNSSNNNNNQSPSNSTSST